jgi:hypothetical protein
MTPRGIVITGASAGIGQALARYYAEPGLALALVGRNVETLEATAVSCRILGADVETIRLDVRDREAMAERLLAFDSVYPVDHVIANAGAALPEDDADAGREVFDINLTGALNTCLPLLPPMVARGRGQIALMSSLAALSPLPDAAAYSVICPGFIATGMGARYQGWRPLEMSADAAAARIGAGLARDRAVIAFPWSLYAAARLGTLVPEPVLRLAMKAFSFSIDRQG